MHKRQLGLSILIGLSVLGCKEDQPKLPTIKLCDYVVSEINDRSKDFLDCRLTNGNTEWQQIIKISDIPAIPNTENEKVICTTLNNITALRIFVENTQRWVDNNCNLN